ncbi:MAG: hypothetical protein QHH80_01570, partial [Anaerolineae bacterium]|nr:hypothetical protein [Anaerolineae bacterium]
MTELGSHDTVLAYFISGLAFFALGLSVALQMGRAHDYPYRRPLVLIAAAAFLRALKKWLDLGALDSQFSRPLRARLNGAAASPLVGLARCAR